MRISDWSSDVCSSDLLRHRAGGLGILVPRSAGGLRSADGGDGLGGRPARRPGRRAADGRLGAHGALPDRERLVWGKGVSVRGELGGCSTLKQKKKADDTNFRAVSQTDS